MYSLMLRFSFESRIAHCSRAGSMKSGWPMISTSRPARVVRARRAPW